METETPEKADPEYRESHGSTRYQPEVEVQRPENLRKFKGQGVDAFLSVRASGSYDGQPQGASARVVSTESGKLLAGVTWQNAWGGKLALLLIARCAKA